MQNLDLFISCRDLPNLDIMSKSDPFVVVSRMDLETETFEELGRTEVIKNNLHPDFKKAFPIKYVFEEEILLQVDVYDSDSKSQDLKDHDYMGGARVVLPEVFKSEEQRKKYKLKNKKGESVGSSSIIIKYEKTGNANGDLYFNLVGKQLDKMDTFGKSDPYFEFFHEEKSGKKNLLLKTEVIKNTLNPTYKGMKVELRKFCGGDLDRRILVKCWDWDNIGSNDLIGSAYITARQMISGEKVPLVNKSKMGKKGYQNSGFVLTEKAEIKNSTSFLEFIEAGCNVGLMMAIDFTGSNGNPQDPKSLHYMSNDRLNQYQTAIKAIGDIVAPYDSDKKFPIWGFGARVGGKVKHCFPLTFDDNNQEVEGVDGLLAAYQNAIGNVKLSGPTYFTEILQTATVSTMSLKPPNYSILVILTDGVINDMETTLQSLFAACDQPLSIVIIGVGGADFKQMEFLDGDEGISYGGKKIPRDIVQFVEFRKFAGRPRELARATLKEIPTQVLKYMQMKNIKIK